MRFKRSEIQMQIICNRVSPSWFFCPSAFIVLQCMFCLTSTAAAVDYLEVSKSRMTPIGPLDSLFAPAWTLEPAQEDLFYAPPMYLWLRWTLLAHEPIFANGQSTELTNGINRMQWLPVDIGSDRKGDKKFMLPFSGSNLTAIYRTGMDVNQMRQPEIIHILDSPACPQLIMHTKN